MPEHTVALCSGGLPRCTRCLLPSGLLGRGACCQVGLRTYALGGVGAGTFCMRYGAFAFAQVVQLACTCAGRPEDAAAAWRVRHMLSGRHPATGMWLGTPEVVALDHEAFYLVLGG